MTESDESNTAANILISMENPEGSQRSTNTRNDEQMTYLEKELDILREKLRQPKTGLGVKSDRIVEPIQLKHQNNTLGLGYEPILEKLHNMQSEKKVFVQEQVPIAGSELVPKSNECIIEGMENLFIAMPEEDYGKNEVDLRMPTIRDVEPREVLQNWTNRSSLFLHESW
ncbi:hypothetical protein HAX54_000678 [Datura stramonium]|uniref:Uncharacterized protein n=1 Tax=Datura stramonium TaxID=4076 RepID=A0ABS8T2B3_DATST|nr:hypothetical protein [Datura stramonium]